MIGKQVRLIGNDGIELIIDPQYIQVVQNHFILFSSVHSDKLGISTFEAAWARAGEVIKITSQGKLYNEIHIN